MPVGPGDDPVVYSLTDVILVDHTTGAPRSLFQLPRGKKGLYTTTDGVLYYGLDDKIYRHDLLNSKP